MGFYIIFGFFMLISWLVGHRLRSKFEKYAQIPVSSGMSGRDIAEKMLRDNDIFDVKVISVEGQLTDHYNPSNKTVNLSYDVYHGRSVSAAAVAAHEVGHAVQHAKAYAWLTMRSNLVPVVSFASRYVQWILLAGVLLISAMPQILLLGIVLFAMTTLFSFITLPVEFDASRRALIWLNSSRIAIGQDNYYAKDALKWAALTYVVAALASLGTLAYYLMIYLGKRD
jgi:Zn-dependent membrane protease YugP